METLTDNINLRAFTAAHNEYIRIYFESGICGIIIMLIIITYIFYSILKNRNTDNIDYLLMILIAFLIYAFTDNCITNFRFWIPFMTVISVVGTYKERLKIRL